MSKNEENVDVNSQSLPPYHERDGELVESRSYIEYGINSDKQKNVRMLYAGPSGTGKSYCVDRLAAELDIPMTEGVGGQGITRLQFEGRWDFDEDGTYWIDGIVPKAIKSANENGAHILKLEEFNMMPPDLQTSINSVLDNQAKISLIEKSGEIVSVNEGCTLIVIITINEGYSGTYELQESVNSRVVYKKKFRHGEPEDEAKIIQMNCDVPYELCLKIAKYGKELRRAYNEVDRSLDVEVTTRELIAMGDLARAGLPVDSVIRCGAANKLSQSDDQIDLAYKLAEGQGLPSTIKKYQSSILTGDDALYDDDELDETEETDKNVTNVDDDDDMFDVKDMNDIGIALDVDNFVTYKVNEIPEKINYQGREYDMTKKYQSYPVGQTVGRILGKDKKVELVTKSPDGKLRSKSTEVKIELIK